MNESANENSEDASRNRRLKVLTSLSILDTPPEQSFDDITRLVAHICEAPVALVSLVDANRQFFKSRFGLPITETPLQVSICKHAIQSEGLFVINDLAADERFAENYLVHGEMHARFYAGAPLRIGTGDSATIGTLCVLDYKPRTLNAAQREALLLLARQVVSQIEVRQINAQQEKIILQLRQTEAELQAAKESAEQANRYKDQSLAFLSHELRTPLTPVLLTATALACDERLPEDVRSDARMINRNIALQTRLVDDLLDVTRLGSGKLELHLERVNICELLRSATELCRAEAAAKNIAVALDLAGETPSLQGDPVRLQQVLINLLKNAIKFTPDGGQVQMILNVCESSPDTETVGATAVPRCLTIEVKDTGIGIDAAALPKIFDAFQQGPHDITRQFGGLGLGLAIARGIVDAHGGKLDAKSDGVGLGATFIVTLPLPTLSATAVATAKPPAARDDQAAAAKASILLVDDHEDTLRAMSRLLKRMQHRVVTATSVQSALDAASKEKFDVVISDVGLPDGTGMDLMRELLGRHPIRGIAVTGYGMESDIINTRAAGFSTHLTKPIDVGDLEAAIGRLTH